MFLSIFDLCNYSFDCIIKIILLQCFDWVESDAMSIAAGVSACSGQRYSSCCGLAARLPRAGPENASGTAGTGSGPLSSRGRRWVTLKLEERYLKKTTTTPPPPHETLQVLVVVHSATEVGYG